MLHKWIGPNIKPEKSGLYIFKKSVKFNKGDKVTLRISADTRYRFYVNGTYVCEGPCQSGGDIKYYEQVDLTEFIKEGINEFKAKVWHIVSEDWDYSFTGVFKKYRPALCAEWEVIRSGESLLFGTDESWELVRETSYAFTHHMNFIHLSETDGIKSYEKMECSILYQAERFSHYNEYGYKELYPLTKSLLPQMQEHLHQQFKTVNSGKDWVELDAGKNLTAKLKFTFSASEKTHIKIYYSECYYKKDQGGNIYKGKRDDAVGELYHGVFDQVILEKGEKTFEPLWWKTFRFIRIESDKPVKIQATFGEYYYPLDIVGEFKCENQVFNKMFDVSIQTLKNCMHEVFIDCPFFEQQQYAMDTALESIFAMTLSCDYRLTKKAIFDIMASQNEDGFLAANWPSQGPKQIIPGFSIYWILLLRNYLMYSGDIDTLKKVFGTVVKVMEAFESLVDENGVVGKSKYWEFFDWVPQWHRRGFPNTALELPMCEYSMLYSYGLGLTAELASLLGRKVLAEYYEQRKTQLNVCIKRVYFDSKKGLYKDTAEEEYSVHTAIWAILCNLESGETAKNMLEKALANEFPKPSLAMTHFYARALEEVGIYEKYFNEFMKDWYNMLELNCTTWFEKAKNARSDCHGWSSSPIYELISSVAGIKPVGFKCDTVIVKPRFVENIKDFTVTLPFANGKITATFNKGEFTVTAPENIKMIVELNGKREIAFGKFTTKV